MIGLSVILSLVFLWASVGIGSAIAIRIFAKENQGALTSEEVKFAACLGPIATGSLLVMLCSERFAPYLNTWSSAKRKRNQG